MQSPQSDSTSNYTVYCFTNKIIEILAKKDVVIKRSLVEISEPTNTVRKIPGEGERR